MLVSPGLSHLGEDGAMSQNYYSEIHLHITWHTIQSMPLPTPTLEPLVHRELKQKIVHTPGVDVHEIGGTENV